MSAIRGLFAGREGHRRLGVLVAVVVIVTVVLVAASFLYNRSPSAKVTVSSAVVYLEQGKTGQGLDWFGVASVNYSTGFPLDSGVSETFTISLPLANQDTVSHRVVDLTANSPFKVLSSSPVTPVLFDSFEDGMITITVEAPGVAGSYALNVTAVCS
ncbi:MAG: hypothetical protein L3K07_03745 [Thermoplasmata archaeon]|nr:hypothetical protein [Thermoplasmata archaeon]